MSLRPDTALLELSESRRRLDETTSFTNIPLLSSKSSYANNKMDYDELQMLKMGEEGSTKLKRFAWIVGLVALLGALVGVLAIGGIQAYNAGQRLDFKPNTKIKGDPSDFKKDSRLHKSFPGICYSPTYSSFYPTCGDTLAEVIEDVQLMSQLTSTIRLYGADCSTPDLVLEAIEKTKVAMKVYLSIYFDSDSVYERQLNATIKVLEKYGADNVLGVTVGNEVVLQAKSGDNSMTVAQATADVVKKAQNAKKQINAISGLSKEIPVGTGEAGTTVTEALAEGVDYIMVNVQVFFADVTIDQAAGWTYDYMQSGDPSVALDASNKPGYFYGEVGWPSNASPNGSIKLNGSEASIDNMQMYLDDFVCQANENGTQAFWFMFQNADWTNAAFGGPEAYFGLFDSDRKLKDGLTIPDCTQNIPDMSVDSTV